MDKRLCPANGRVAATRLFGQVTADEFVDGSLAQIGASVADLSTVENPHRRDRQLLFGDQVQVYERRNGVAFCAAEKDGYVGYVDEALLVDPVDPTHFVSVPATHLYRRADIKLDFDCALSFGSRIRIVGGKDAFYETHTGQYVPRVHVRPVKVPLHDPATVAQQFFGVPYLWGGNSHSGIDCSGLVQLAMLACGIECPADSDMQEAALGDILAIDAAVQRGDLLFWKGHVAMAVDSDTLIHATAHQMAVTYEPILDAIARIEEQGGGAVTSKKRV